MCDACEYPLSSTSTASRVLGRRALLRRAGIGGAAAAAAALVLPDGIAGALGPPYESVQLGEDQLSAVVPAVSAAAVPAVAPNAPRRQSSGRISAPAIVSRAEWGADESIRTAERGFAPIRKFVIHHTDSANKPRNPVQVVRDMYQYHVKGRGFSDVGYNFAIDHRGTIYEGRWSRHYAPGEIPDGIGEVAVGRDELRAERQDLQEQRILRIASAHACREVSRHPQRELFAGLAGRADEVRVQPQEPQKLGRVGHGIGQDVLPPRPGRGARDSGGRGL